MTTGYSPLDLETVFAAEFMRSDRVADPHRLTRTGHIVFEYHEGRIPHYEIRAFGKVFPELKPGGPSYVGRLDRDEIWMTGAIDDCLAPWEDYVADHFSRVPGEPPFIPDRAHIDAAAPELTRAGDQLFSSLFLQGDDGLRQIGQLLTEALKTGQQVLTFHSDRLFAPWWMIYSPTDGGEAQLPGAAWTPSGFWGYSHLIEHEFLYSIAQLDHRIRPREGQLQVSLNLDVHLDDRHKAPVTHPVRAFFEDNKQIYTHVVRSTRDELAAALSSPAFSDQVLYFCCHCGPQQSSRGPRRAELRLSDQQRISAGHLSGWLWEQHLPSNPMVFVNVCEGGAMGSPFYASFGHELIRKAANCVVAPQIQVPAVFAGEYAVELFTQFLQPHRHLGRVVRDIARTFMDRHHNPLGLLYGLYRGLDTRLVESEASR